MEYELAGGLCEKCGKKHGVYSNSRTTSVWAMVKYTHDEFQYIQLSINYESPASLAMHQLRRGKVRHTVQWVLEAEKKAYTAHEKCECSMLCLCADMWEDRGMKALTSSRANNKPVCFCMGGMWGLFSLYIVSLVVLTQNPPIWCWIHCFLIDYTQIFHSCNAIHRFWHAAVTKLHQKLRLWIFRIKKHNGLSREEWRIHWYTHMHKNIKSTNKQNVHILRGLGDRPHQSHHRHS